MVKPLLCTRESSARLIASPPQRKLPSRLHACPSPPSPHNNTAILMSVPLLGQSARVFLERAGATAVAALLALALYQVSAHWAVLSLTGVLVAAASMLAGAALDLPYSGKWSQAGRFGPLSRRAPTQVAGASPSPCYT